MEWASSGCGALLACLSDQLVGRPIDEILQELSARADTVEVRVRRLDEHSFVAVLGKR